MAPLPKPRLPGDSRPHTHDIVAIVLVVVVGVAVREIDVPRIVSIVGDRRRRPEGP